MADDASTRTLLLQINATTEVLRSQLSAAEKSVADFTSRTEHHLSDADKRFESLGHSLERLERPLEHLKVVGEAAFGFLIGESLLNKGREALEFAGNIEFMSQQIGVSTDFLQKFRYAASQSGASLEVSDTALTKFARSVGEAANGNKAIIKLFNDLGVSVLDASGKVRSVEQVFLDTAKGIARLPDPAQRTADTLTLMGRGAGALIPLLSRGATGFNELAASAEQLGIVISPDFIEHAEEVNHKFAALKLTLDAQMANAVARNAESIEGLATALVSITAAVLKFQQAHPEVTFALLGAYLARGLGPYGMLAAAIGGAALGHQVHENADDASSDLPFRRQALINARNQYHVAENYRPAESHARDGIGGPPSSAPNLGDARAEVFRQINLLNAAVAQTRAGRPSEHLGSEGAGSHNPDISRRGPSEETLARRAEEERKREVERRKRVADEAARLDSQALEYQSQLTSNTAEQLGIARQKVDTETRRQLDDINAGVNDGRIRAEEAVGLRLRINDNEILQQQIIDRRADNAAEQLSFRLQDEELANIRESLGISASLASTRRERLDLERRSLAAEQAAERERLTHTINDRDRNGNLLAGDADIAVARQGLSTLNDRYAARGRAIDQNNESPLDAYRRRLKEAAGDTSDALQQVEVNALGGLESKITDTIGKVLGLKGAFGELATSIISDLARIEIERLILGATGGGGGLLSSISHLFGGGKASGGAIDPTKFYLVGENGPELFAPGRSGTIIPNGSLKSSAVPSMSASSASARAPMQIQLVVRKGEAFAAEVIGVSGPHTVSIVQAAAPALVDASTTATIARLRQPSL